MANYLATDTDLTAVANAIRTKGGTSAQMAFPNGFVSAVNAIPTGGGGGGIDPFPLPDGYSLPANCQKLLYAESSAEQICDTGVHPTLETKVEIVGYFIPGAYGEYKYLTGCINPMVYMSSNSYNGFPYWGFGNKSDFANMWSSLNGFPICTISKTEGRVQNPPFADVHQNCGATSMSGSPDTTIAIFGRYNGRTAERLAPTRFFRERIWEDDTLIRCIFPVLKDEEEVCLYDVINAVYMPNLGTAPLVGGMSL